MLQDLRKKKLKEPSTSKVKGKGKAKSKSKVSKPPKTPAKKDGRPAFDLHDCSDNSELEFYLVEIKAAGDKSAAFSFQFWAAPKRITITTRSVLNEPKTQGNVEHPIGFQYLDNLKVLMADCLFDGKGRGILPGAKLEQLRSMQRPLARNQLRVFELIIKNGQQATRSYGYFIVQLGVVTELLRENKSGRALRFSLDIELTRAPSYQLNTGNDLAIPADLIPTLPPTPPTGESAPAAEGGSAPAADGSVIAVGTLLCKTGGAKGGGTSGSSTGPHLHFSYWPLNLGAVQGSAAVRSYFESTYARGGSQPNFCREAIGWGKDKKSLNLAPKGSQPGARRSVATSGGQSSSSFHKGEDIPLADNTPLWANQPLTFVSYTNGGRVGLGLNAIFRCDVAGYAGYYAFGHLNIINPDVTKKISQSSNPNKNSSSSPAVPAKLPRGQIQVPINSAQGRI